jgi:hypothetical protein
VCGALDEELFFWRYPYSFVVGPAIKPKLVEGQNAMPMSPLLFLEEAEELIVDNRQSTIPAFILPAVQKLIHKLWKHNYWRRLTFNQILDWLEGMKFKLTTNVNSLKLSTFVKKIKHWEEIHDVSPRARNSAPICRLISHFLSESAAKQHRTGKQNFVKSRRFSCDALQCVAFQSCQSVREGQ